LTVLSFLFTFCLAASADNLGDAFKTKDGKVNDPLDAAAKAAHYNTTSGASDINQIIALIIQSVLGILGVIFLILIIYGGAIWMTAEGDEEKVKRAQKIIRNATIGLLIVISAYAISYFVIIPLFLNY